MTPEILILAGVGAAVVFVVVLQVEGGLRPGYHPTYHTGSEWSLGMRGWIQRANFLIMAGGVVAFSVGVGQILGTTVGPVLLVTFGFGPGRCGCLRSGLCAWLPTRGPDRPSARPSWQHQAHSIVGGPIAFFALFGACLALAGQLQDAWRWYTVLTAIAGLGMTTWTALAYRRGAARTGLIQRGLIVVYWSWIVVLGIHLVTNPEQP